MKKLLSVISVLVLAAAGLSAQDRAVAHVGTTDFVPPGTTLDLTAVDQAVGVAKLWYRINGGEATVYTQPLVFQDEGRYTVYHWAEDLLGNVTAPQTVSFVVDATAPTWKWATRGPSFLKDGVTYLKSTTGILILASDQGAGVGSISFSLDNQSYIPFKDEAFVNQPGERSAWAFATDLVGNKSEPAEIKLFVDDQAPEVALVPIDPFVVAKGERYAKPGSLVAVRAKDDGAGVKAIEVSVNRQEFFTYTEPLAFSDAGAYSVRARAVDQLGNTSVTQELTFVVDAVGPVTQSGKLTVAAPAPAPVPAQSAEAAPAATPAP